MTCKKEPSNQGIIVSGGQLTAGDLVVGANASITKQAFDEAPLSSNPSLIRRKMPRLPITETKQYDVFISHASEDKEEIVRPLAASLLKLGVEVWFDEFELRIGDGLRGKIDRGLANSRLGIVVLSRHYLTKGWANYELDGIIARAITGEQVLLPIWHNITKEEVLEFSPTLSDKLSRSTTGHSIEDIAKEISELLQKPREHA